MNEDLTVERRLGGAGMRLTPAEKREIALAYLTDPDLGTISACAKHFTRTREAIAGCLKGDGFEALRQRVDVEAGDAAKGILKRARVKAATAWVETAIDAAAEKGDHKPARDLLVATKVIEPAPATTQMYVGILQANGRVSFSDGKGNHYDEVPADSGLAVIIGAADSDVQVTPVPPLAIDGEISRE